MKKIKERTIYFIVYLLVLIPLLVISLMTGCLIFGMIVFVVAIFCVKSYIKNLKAYRKYNSINTQVSRLEIEGKIELIFKNCDNWLMFASDDEIKELERMFTKMKMTEAGKYELEYILCRSKNFQN